MGALSRPTHEEDAVAGQVIAVATVAGLLLLQLAMHALDRVGSRHHHTSEMLRHAYRELTVMGLIAFVLFIIEQTEALKSSTELVIQFESIHIMLFILACVFLIAVVALIGMSVITGEQWEKTENNYAFDFEQYKRMRARFVSLQRALGLRAHPRAQTTGERPGGNAGGEGAAAAGRRGSTGGAAAAPSVTLAMFLHPLALFEYTRLLPIIRFLEQRHKFIKRNALPGDFSFAAYLRKCKQHVFRQLVQLPTGVWVAFVYAMTLDMYLRAVWPLYAEKVTATVVVIIGCIVVVSVSLIIFMKIRAVHWAVLHSSYVRLGTDAAKLARSGSMTTLFGGLGLAQSAGSTPVPAVPKADDVPAVISASRDASTIRIDHNHTSMILDASAFAAKPDDTRAQATAGQVMQAQTAKTADAVVADSQLQAQRRLFWFGMPVLLLRLMQLVMFVASLTVALSVRFWYNFAGGNSILVPILVVASCFVAVWFMRVVVPLYIITLHTGEMVDLTLLVEAVEKQRSMEKDRRRTARSDRARLEYERQHGPLTLRQRLRGWFSRRGASHVVNILVLADFFLVAMLASGWLAQPARFVVFAVELALVSLLVCEQSLRTWANGPRAHFCGTVGRARAVDARAPPWVRARAPPQIDRLSAFGNAFDAAVIIVALASSIHGFVTTSRLPAPKQTPTSSHPHEPNSQEGSVYLAAVVCLRVLRMLVVCRVLRTESQLDADETKAAADKEVQALVDRYAPSSSPVPRADDEHGGNPAGAEASEVAAEAQHTAVSVDEPTSLSAQLQAATPASLATPASANAGADHEAASLLAQLASALRLNRLVGVADSVDTTGTQISEQATLGGLTLNSRTLAGLGREAGLLAAALDTTLTPAQRLLLSRAADAIGRDACAQEDVNLDVDERLAAVAPLPEAVQARVGGGNAGSNRVLGKPADKAPSLRTLFSPLTGGTSSVSGGAQLPLQPKAAVLPATSGVLSPVGPPPIRGAGKLNAIAESPGEDGAATPLDGRSRAASDFSAPQPAQSVRVASLPLPNDGATDDTAGLEPGASMKSAHSSAQVLSTLRARAHSNHNARHSASSPAVWPRSPEEESDHGAGDDDDDESSPNPPVAQPSARKPSRSADAALVPAEQQIPAPNADARVLLPLLRALLPEPASGAVPPPTAAAAPATPAAGRQAATPRLQPADGTGLPPLVAVVTDAPFSPRVPTTQDARPATGRSLPSAPQSTQAANSAASPGDRREARAATLSSPDDGEDPYAKFLARAAHLLRRDSRFDTEGAAGASPSRRSEPQTGRKPHGGRHTASKDFGLSLHPARLASDGAIDDFAGVDDDESPASFAAGERRHVEATPARSLGRFSFMSLLRRTPMPSHHDQAAPSVQMNSRTVAAGTARELSIAAAEIVSSQRPTPTMAPAAGAAAAAPPEPTLHPRHAATVSSAATHGKHRALADVFRRAP